MRLIIAGGRDYRLTSEDLEYLDSLLPEVREVITGGARGADQDGAAWAHRHGIPVVVFQPNWKRFGRAAGPIRNREMAAIADAVALFPGGRGTADMLAAARTARLRVLQRRMASHANQIAPSDSLSGS